MKSFFAKLKFRTKLLLLVAVPTVGLLAAATIGIMQHRAESAQMGRLVALAGVSTKIGAVVHELQKERGVTAGFLGSKGAQFARELPLQRADTDRRRSELKAALERFDAGAYGAALPELLREAAAGIAAVVAQRDAVSAQSVNMAAAVGTYTKAIAALLAIPSRVPMLSDARNVSSLASAYADLMYAKEMAGRERAILSGAFGAGGFAPGVYNQFVSTASAQDVYMSMFRTFASAEQKALLRARLSGPVVEEVAHIKASALAGGDKAKLDVDAAHWFKVATERIDLLKEVEDRLASDLVAGADGVRTAAHRAMLLSLALAALAIGLTALLTYIVIANLLRDLGGEPAYAAEIANRVGAGDLSMIISTKANDTTSLLAGLKSMKESLMKIVGEVRSGAEAIGSGTKQIAMGNADLSSRTEEQASSLEETASSMEELTSTVKQNAENAHQANQLAQGASVVAVKGGQVVSEVVGTMSAIEESSKKIMGIISVIDGIAFQTNILALNAAVEAARAGEQGRGFAVVASEVRNLAQRSAAAAKEIKALIGDSVDKVGTGTRLVDEAGETMSQIVGSVKRVTDIMSEITAASQEQSAGIEQVNQAITQMDEVTQQNAALVEEAAAAAESLEEQARNLETVVSVFNLSGAGTSLGNKFDFHSAVDAHSSWKQRLQAFIAGKGEALDAAVVGGDDRCVLGGWIYGPGKDFAKYGEYGALRSAHASFHRCAGEVVRLSQAGRREEATRALENEFVAESKTTVKCIYEMKDVVGGARVSKRERRSPTRAPNMARLPGKAAKAQPAATRPKLAVAGGRGEEAWQEL